MGEISMDALSTELHSMLDDHTNGLIDHWEWDEENHKLVLSWYRREISGLQELCTIPALSSTNGEISFPAAQVRYAFAWAGASPSADFETRYFNGPEIGQARRKEAAAYIHSLQEEDALSQEDAAQIYSDLENEWDNSRDINTEELRELIDGLVSQQEKTGENDSGH